MACFLSGIKTPRCSVVYLYLKPWNLATVLFAKLLRRGVKYREPVSNAKLSKKGPFPCFPSLRRKSMLFHLGCYFHTIRLQKGGKRVFFALQAFAVPVEFGSVYCVSIRRGMQALSPHKSVLGVCDCCSTTTSSSRCSIRQFTHCGLMQKKTEVKSLMKLQAAYLS